MSSMTPDSPQLQSYVWHKGKCFYIYTFERDSSASCAPPVPRYSETWSWEYDWDARKKGDHIARTGDGRALTQHNEMVRQLFETGTFVDPRDA